MKNRIAFYDLLRAISIFAVITMHVIGNTINTFGLTGTPADVYNAICELMYFAVPMFIMISGSLFLNPKRELDTKTLYKKYILKMVIALFLFGMFYSMLEIYFNTRTIDASMIVESVKNVFTGNLWAHMWYLYLIIGLYMITPLLRVFTAHSKREDYRYMLLVLFIFTIFLVDICNYFNLYLAFNILIISPYIFFYMLGDYLSRYDVSKKVRVLIYTTSIVSVILIALNNFIHLFASVLVTYTSCLMSSIIVSLFLLAKSTNMNFNEKTKGLLKSVGECGFGIYLIHQFIINIIYKLLKLDFILNYPYIGLILYVLAIFVISYIIIYILRKIKLLRNYLI